MNVSARHDSIDSSHGKSPAATMKKKAATCHESGSLRESRSKRKAQTTSEVATSARRVYEARRTRRSAATIPSMNAGSVRKVEGPSARVVE